LDEEQDFVPVIDAIQGEGFNPLWRQILIVFNPGFAPHQFLSADEVRGRRRRTESRDHPYRDRRGVSVFVLFG
jgi:hypothetical protein